jgi:hypothetical protein
MHDNKTIPLKLSTTLKCTFWGDREYNDSILINFTTSASKKEGEGYKYENHNLTGVIKSWNKDIYNTYKALQLKQRDMVEITGIISLDYEEKVLQDKNGVPVKNKQTGKEVLAKVYKPIDKLYIYITAINFADVRFASEKQNNNSTQNSSNEFSEDIPL